MLDSSVEARLFGVRHRDILAALLVLGSVLVVLLLINLFQIHYTLPGPELSREALQYLQGAGIRQVTLLLLLLVIMAAGILTIRHYYATKERLARLHNAATAVLDNFTGGILTLDLEGKPGLINRGAYGLLGLKYGEPFDLGRLESTNKELASIIREALADRKYVQDHDLKMTLPGGSNAVLRVSTSEHTDESGERAGAIVVIRDATRQVEMEQRLRKRDRLAAVGTLAAGVAHEIRNPLSALMLNVGLMRDELMSGTATPEELESYFDVLTAETKRLDRITGNFLQLARPGPVNKTLLPVSEPLLQVLRLLEIEARENHVAFETQFEDGGAAVVGDLTKLEQLFLNILINGIQAMPRGGIMRVATRTAGDEDGPFVEISFADTGVGIPAEDIPRLFDPYFTTRESGTGLGLAIADRIATDHGGRILVTSAVGKGTTFTVRLPLAAEQKEAADGR